LKPGGMSQLNYYLIKKQSISLKEKNLFNDYQSRVTRRENKSFSNRNL